MRNGLIQAAAMTSLLAGSAVLAQQAAPQLVLSSSAFTDGGNIQQPYVCADSKNFSRHSLPLAWTGAPEGTKSFALTMHDTDVHVRKAAAPALHWLIFNIPGTANKLAANLPLDGQLADGTRQTKSVIGQPGYMGPCPPPGKPHHYVMELYALDVVLDVPPEGTREDVLKAMDGHVLSSGVMVGVVSK